MELMQEENVENNKIHEIRLIVAGTRTFDDYVLMREKLDQIILGLQEDYSGAPVVIISVTQKAPISLASGMPWSGIYLSAGSPPNGTSTAKLPVPCEMPRC